VSPGHRAPLNVVHNEAESCFEAYVDGLQCRADYHRAGDTLFVTHTQVPPMLEGRGIAAAIVRAVFDHAAAHGLRVAPRCSYVHAWVRRHPEFADRVAR
jgi:hypothetical protein